MRSHPVHDEECTCSIEEGQALDVQMPSTTVADDLVEASHELVERHAELWHALVRGWSTVGRPPHHEFDHLEIEVVHGATGRVSAVESLGRGCGQGSHRPRRMKSAARSPIMIAGALVLPVTRVGMTEVSATRTLLNSRTRNCSSTTLPIMQVPDG